MQTSLDDQLVEARKAVDRLRDRDRYDQSTLRLRILCDPSVVAVGRPELANTEFGMQDRASKRFESGGSASTRVFELGAIGLKDRSTGALRFIGPFVQGPIGDEFIYLNWKSAGEPGPPWVWRIKMSLQRLAWDDIIAAERDGRVFEFDATGRAPHQSPRIEWTISS